MLISNLQFFIYLLTSSISIIVILTLYENFKSSIFQSLDPASHASFRIPEDATNCILNLNTFILDPLSISQLYVAFGLLYAVLITVRQYNRLILLRFYEVLSSVVAFDLLVVVVVRRRVTLFYFPQHKRQPI